MVNVWIVAIFVAALVIKDKINADTLKAAINKLKEENEKEVDE